MSLLCRIKRAAAQGLSLRIGLWKCMLLNGYQKLQASSDRFTVDMNVGLSLTSCSSILQSAARKHSHADIK